MTAAKPARACSSSTNGAMRCTSCTCARRQMSPPTTRSLKTSGLDDQSQTFVADASAPAADDKQENVVDVTELRDRWIQDDRHASIPRPAAQAEDRPPPGAAAYRRRLRLASRPVEHRNDDACQRRDRTADHVLRRQSRRDPDPFRPDRQDRRRWVRGSTSWTRPSIFTCAPITSPSFGPCASRLPMVTSPRSRRSTPKGEMIIQFFGKRKEGFAERPEWRDIAEGLARLDTTVAA